MTAQRCAHVVNGVVANAILADPSTFSYGDGSLVIASATANVGDTYSGGVFTPGVPVVSYPTQLTFLQFMALFSPTEQAAVVTSTDVQVKLFVLMASGAGDVNLTDPIVVGGVNYLASKSVITSARATTILSGAPPS